MRRLHPPDPVSRLCSARRMKKASCWLRAVSTGLPRRTVSLQYVPSRGAMALARPDGESATVPVTGAAGGVADAQALINTVQSDIRHQQRKRGNVMIWWQPRPIDP